MRKIAGITILFILFITTIVELLIMSIIMIWNIFIIGSVMAIIGGYKLAMSFVPESKFNQRLNQLKEQNNG
ncbi:hypothetical protein HYO99_gp10 [Roseobacter phage RD-1410W1-01]|uniref:Uncharacterized protein n=1 Tax=Roseobacter phage RD-1410W1-01 TaxID=1815984 RepID=A0A191VYF7_9CAUD|nr:hypothetical protein HYO99_gp10 [Roseobacter phage RD-1410W1-01]ANJ20744.1 hypothetical protein RDp01_gp10 [Roseobacter phage RD-1410W1-01]